VSKRIIFRDNTLYDGPRAGVNVNDGFGGGHGASNGFWLRLSLACLGRLGTFKRKRWRSGYYIPDLTSCVSICAGLVLCCAIEQCCSGM
jgi:hypothetical protein